MQTEKALINDRLHVLKVSRKFWIPTIYNLVSDLPVSKVGYFLTVSIVFSVYKQNFTAQ